MDIDMLQIICGKEKILLLSVQNERPASITDLDPTTPDTCDSNYFLQSASLTRGQLQSDQELFSTPGADDVIAHLLTLSVLIKHLSLKAFWSP